MKEGIGIAGMMCADVIKMIDAYPEKGMLCDIRSVGRGVGGCVPNTAIDLAVIDPALRIKAYGAVGEDEYGDFLRAQLAAHGIDAGGVKTVRGVPTGFTDVMTVSGTGERTFFSARGANALFDFDDAFVGALDVKLFHIGYILLMDKLDAADPQYGTRLARLLKAVRARGIATSVDVVSAEGARFRETVPPALRYCDYAVVNEIEACAAAGLSPRKADGSLDGAALRTAAERLFALGVDKAVVIHCPEAGFALERDGTWTAVPSLALPAEHIRGSVGAGDAFCAGALYGFYHGWEARRILEFASCTAACNLEAADSVSGMRPRAEAEALAARYGRRSL